MTRQKNGMVLTSQGWMGRREYQANGFLKIQVPEELLVTDKNLKLAKGQYEKKLQSA
jgi:hypothetical protein